eukprot:2374624-Amphidinium_carterae.3
MGDSKRDSKPPRPAFCLHYTPLHDKVDALTLPPVSLRAKEAVFMRVPIHFSQPSGRVGPRSQ